MRCATADLVPPALSLSTAPDQSQYDAADPQLREAAALLQRALNAESVQEEEALWTQVRALVTSFCVSALCCCRPLPCSCLAPHTLTHINIHIGALPQLHPPCTLSPPPNTTHGG